MVVIKLYLIAPEKYFEGVMRVLKKEIKNTNTIFVTTNKPYGHLINTFKKHGIPHNKTFFIDCISKYVGEKIEQEPENCLFVEGPQNLTAIGIAINESVKHLPGKKTMFLDSLSTLLIYHDSNTLSKFSNFFINKMRVLDIDTIVLALESDINKEAIKLIQSLADEVKKYGG